MTRLTHGMWGSKTYKVRHNMLQRTTNKRNTRFANYGGRGISVCDRWKKFENFLADMGECEVGKTLDRRNNDGNYEPGNCRWSTLKEQNNNTRWNHLVSWRGETRTVSQWATVTGICANTLLYRIRRGWTTERALKERPHIRQLKSQAVKDFNELYHEGGE